MPIGLIRDPTGIISQGPEPGGASTVDLLFQTFLRVRTVAKVMREFNDRGPELPRRNRHGDLRWARATTAAVPALLKNPACGGAFFYGRTRLRKPPDGRSPTKASRSTEQWRLVEGPLPCLYSARLSLTIPLRWPNEAPSLQPL